MTNVRPPGITMKTRLGMSGSSYGNLLNEVDSALDALDEMETANKSFPSIALDVVPACTTKDKIADFDKSAERPKRGEYPDEDSLELAVLEYRKAVNSAREACIDCPIRSHCLAYSLTSNTVGDKIAPDRNMVYGGWTATTRRSIIFRLFENRYYERHPERVVEEKEEVDV